MNNKKSTFLFAVFAVLAIACLSLDSYAQSSKKNPKKTSAKRKTIVRKKSEPKYIGSGPAFTISSGSSPTTVTSQTPPDAKGVSYGVVNGKAVGLVIPAYPPAAKAVHASGAVNVQVTIDEKGNVTSADAVSGHPLLQQSAENAARASKFSPTILNGQPVIITGIIVYNFVAQ